MRYETEHEGRKVGLAVECWCVEHCPYDKAGKTHCDVCSRCNQCHNGKRFLTVDEVEEILLTSEKYEGLCVGITGKQMGINNMLNTYLNIKGNPLTDLTYKGKPVTVEAI